MKIIYIDIIDYLYLIISLLPLSINSQLTQYNEVKNITSSAEHNSEKRIIGGYNATKGEFPYQVSIKRKYNNMYTHFCGGSIITRTSVLTAAHCSNDSRNLVVMFGRLEVIYISNYSRRVSRVINHEKYDSNVKNDDISIYVLSEELIYWKDVLPITISERTPEIGEKCLLSGWGKSDGMMVPTVLKAAVFEITYDCETMSDCDENKQISAYTSDSYACFGDSGSPLVCNNKLAGIVSWGINSTCVGFTVFTNVFYYRDWILKNIDKLIEENVEYNSTLNVSSVKFNFLLLIIFIILLYITHYFPIIN